MSVLALILTLAALIATVYLAIGVYRLLNGVLDHLANTITLDLDQENPMTDMTDHNRRAA